MNTANDLNSDPKSVAAWVARFLKERGVDRIFGLQGGHIQPIWDHAAQMGIRIVDVRHECAAVHMAHAHGRHGDALNMKHIRLVCTTFRRYGHSRPGSLGEYHTFFMPECFRTGAWQK